MYLGLGSRISNVFFLVSTAGRKFRKQKENGSDRDSYTSSRKTKLRNRMRISTQRVKVYLHKLSDVIHIRDPIHLRTYCTYGWFAGKLSVNRMPLPCYLDCRIPASAYFCQNKFYTSPDQIVSCQRLKLFATILSV